MPGLYVLEIFFLRIGSSQTNNISYESKSQVCIDVQSLPEAFKRHYAELSRLVSDFANRLALAPELFGAHLITMECYNSATDNSPKPDAEKGVLLMKGLMFTIKEQPQLLTTLIDSLKKVDAFKSVAEKMQCEPVAEKVQCDLLHTCNEGVMTSNNRGM